MQSVFVRVTELMASKIINVKSFLVIILAAMVFQDLEWCRIRIALHHNDALIHEWRRK